MLSLPDSRRYFLYSPATDMRKGFDSLCGLVRHHMGGDPLGSDVFIFLNHRRTHVKLLVWERDGLSIYYKRLERGTYELPAPIDSNASVELSSQQLMLILEGICLGSVKKRKRFSVDN